MSDIDKFLRQYKIVSENGFQKFYYNEALEFEIDLNKFTIRINNHNKGYTTDDLNSLYGYIKALKQVFSDLT
jgi:hypothetical protein